MDKIEQKMMDIMKNSSGNIYDVFLILYKRKENGNFCWLRTADEALEISLEQHRMLKQRLEIVAKWPIEESSKPSFAM